MDGDIFGVLLLPIIFTQPAGRGSTAMVVTTAGALRLLPKIERGLSFIRTDALRLP